MHIDSKLYNCRLCVRLMCLFLESLVSAEFIGFSILWSYGLTYTATGLLDYCEVNCLTAWSHPKRPKYGPFHCSRDIGRSRTRSQTFYYGMHSLPGVWIILDVPIKAYKRYQQERFTWRSCILVACVLLISDCGVSV
ncbi:hypothetical protein F4813DRAFT_293590 [Daldinia decipiens]|uniref:uncharacterized protein n=1 Tax=Daldinia decipiens TaxID=326647 RepID=UPI0020C40826|nr:uncharacterized protein F4813DRAFT_293590 [Daldinia decipiens]KAI1660402.1 hypothetical protein F4813DRAFT_293590 [Daldinia decipiens]